MYLLLSKQQEISTRNNKNIIDEDNKMDTDKNYIFKGLIIALLSLFFTYALNYLKVISNTQDTNVQWMILLGGISSLIYFILGIVEFYDKYILKQASK